MKELIKPRFQAKTGTHGLFEFEIVLKFYNLEARTFKMTPVLFIMHFAQKADPEAIKIG